MPVEQELFKTNLLNPLRQTLTRRFQGFRGTVTNRLRNSLSGSLGEEAAAAPDAVLKGYRVGSGNTVCFFRDDKLSDEIGFNYSTWHADDAVANFIHHLEQIAKAYKKRNLALPNILDGENAWEY